MWRARPARIITTVVSGFAALVVLLALLLAAGALASSGAESARNQSSITAAAPQPPRTSRVVESRFWSPSLGREMPFEVYLPPGYDSDVSARFPVLYMLHGLGGDYRSWQSIGLFDTATRLIEQGLVPPMIIVTPEGESGYWLDHANGGPRFGAYVSKDLVSFVDSTFRTDRQPDARAIGGLSMGGHGALQIALNNPGEFSIVGAHSIALRTKEQAFDFFGDRAYYQAHDPVSIIAKDPGRARDLSIWIDIGSSDPWLARAALLHDQMAVKGLAHSWQVWLGGHDSAYWSAHLADYLSHYGSAFTARRLDDQWAWASPRP
jgi:enterochelin esterase-like enzyme